jgi:hypothetical protein
MMQRNEDLIGELLFRTRDGGGVVVLVYRGKSTFTLTRLGEDERPNINSWGGKVDDWIREAMLEWSDLVREDVKWTPRS